MLSKRFQHRLFIQGIVSLQRYGHKTHTGNRCNLAIHHKSRIRCQHDLSRGRNRLNNHLDQFI